MKELLPHVLIDLLHFVNYDVVFTSKVCIRDINFKSYCTIMSRNLTTLFNNDVRTSNGPEHEYIY